LRIQQRKQHIISNRYWKSDTTNGSKLRFVKCNFNTQTKKMERGFTRTKRIKKTDLKFLAAPSGKPSGLRQLIRASNQNACIFLIRF